MTNEVVLYTDGGCIGNPGPGGWAAILVRSGRYEEMGGREPATTNNRMEMTAALRGLERCRPGDRVRVVTDSRYLVDGMTRWLRGWKARGWRKADKEPVLNQDLWQALEAAAKDRQVRWEHVAGHAGHPENERCDRIANAYARGEKPELRTGDGSWIYGPTPDAAALAEVSDDRLPQPVYLSCVEGAVEEHATWADCEVRIKGVKGARCKKVHSKSEYFAAMLAWRHLA
jgi:ribonuclease HI